MDHEVVRDVLHGKLNKERWSSPRIVKVYISSTKGDMVEERRNLLEVVGPDLHSKLESLGIEVEMVDLFYGEDEEFVWDLAVLEDRKKEIEHCFRVSRGCFFISLVGNRYGKCPLPEVLPKEEFEEMIKLSSQDQVSALKKHYLEEKDGYHLNKTGKTGEKWITSRHLMEPAIFNYRTLRHKEPKSVLELEFQHALSLASNSKNKVLVVMRKWDGLCSSEDESELLHDLRDMETEDFKVFIQNSIPDENIISYEVPWNSKGIDPDIDEHEKYLSYFNEDIGDRLHEMIRQDIKQNPEVKARNKNIQEVYNEAAMHLNIIEELASTSKENHWINSESFRFIKKLITKDQYSAGQGSQHLPFILHGAQLSGKTSFLHTIYQDIENWFEKPVVRIVRSCAISPRSSYSLELVRVMCQQLAFVLNEPLITKDTSFEPTYIWNWFQNLLLKFQEANEKILFFLLDDIHRLNTLDAGTAGSLCWIPISLPHNVFILATSSVPVQVLRMTPVQKDKFSSTASYRVLHSFQPIDVYAKKLDLRLHILERRFGRLALSRVSNLLSCTEYGLSETEILEILMPTNDINEIISLRQGLLNFASLASMKVAMGDLLYEKQMSGKLLLLWRHTHTQETFCRKYATHEILKQVHTEIANLFFLEFIKNEEAANNEEMKDTEEEETKDTPFQLHRATVDVTYNIRHVEEAWIHLLKAGSHSGLKDLCVCNFDMALACVQSISVGYLRCLLEHARSYLLDRDLELVYHTLRKASLVLSRDALQLPTQFICWLRPVSGTSGEVVARLVLSAMAWCDGYTEPLLVPLTAWLLAPLPLQIRQVTCKTGVRLIEPTPTCQHMVIVPDSGDPQLWHIMTNAIVHTFSGHTGPVTCLSITRQTPFLITGSEDTSVRIWDLKTFQLRHTIREHIASVLCVCAALHNSIVCSGGEDSRIIITSMATGEVTHKVDHHRGPVTALRVTSTSDVLVSASADKTICLWALDDGVVLLNTMELSSPILLMSITADDVFVLACCEDNRLYLRTLTTGTELHTLCGPKDKVQSLCLAYDNRRAVVGAEDGRVYIIDLHSGRIIRTMPTLMPNVTGVHVSDRDDFLITGGATRVTFWSFRLEEDAPPTVGPKTHSGHITCLAVSRDGILAATGATDCLVNIWHLNSHTLQCSMEGHVATVTCVSIAPNGLFAVSGSEDNQARVWGLTLGLTVSVYKKHQSPISAVSILIDSRRVVSLDLSGNLAIWLADDASSIQMFPLASSGQHLAVSCNMKYAVFGLNELSLRIWSLEKDDEKYTVNHVDEITCFVISADSNLLITGSKDQSLKVWQLTGGKLTQVLVGHSDQVTCVGVSVNNKSQVISGSRDNNLIIWDVITGCELHTLTGHQGTVTCVALTADSTTALSGSEDTTIIVWDTKTGRPLTSLALHVPIVDLAMTSDASRIAVHLADQTALPIICLHNTPATYVKMPSYVPPKREVQAPDMRPGVGLKRPTSRLLKKEVSLDTYTWQKKYGHLTSNVMMAAVDERLKRRFSVSASMEEISKLPQDAQGSQQLGPEQAALAQSQHFDQLEALWNKRSPPRRRMQFIRQTSRQSDPPTPLQEDPSLSDD